MQKSLNHFYMRCLFFILLSLASVNISFPQQENITAVDSMIKISNKNLTDSVKPHNPKIATIRSAILPGWGQIYNKKYWKLPLVYGALGTAAGVFAFNLREYRETRFAYRVKYNMRVNHTDSALYDQIANYLKPLSEESLRTYRNEYRRRIDYSVLAFIVCWALNIVDATVDAHLKTFDVSPDLSLQIIPGRSELAGTNGISLVLKIGKHNSR